MTVIKAPYPQGEAAEKAASLALNPLAQGMIGSRILGIAGQVRAKIAAGEEICNLTIGDFSPQQFTPPRALLDKINEFMSAGNTNYPPADGIPELRQAIVDYYKRNLGVELPMESVVVGSGARPPLFATYMCLLEQGDTLVYAVPSWNNEYYAYLNGANAVAVQTSPDVGFMPTLEQLAPHLPTARVVHLNTPLNPCGTAISEQALRDICQAIVAENERRNAEGRKSLFLLFDMVYWMLNHGETEHHDPISLVPEIAPYVVYVDAISKSFAATGLRVGWGIVPPYIQGKFKALIGHMGAWAPRPEQMATSWILSQDALVNDWLGDFKGRIQERLDLIYARFQAMAAEGLPVRAIEPQGAIYLSIQVNLIGRTLPSGELVETNEQIREYLLNEARVAVVPFRAFGLLGENGWFRMSIGAVGVEELGQALDRIAEALRKTHA